MTTPGPEHIAPIADRLFIRLREIALKPDQIHILVDTGHGELRVPRRTFDEWQRSGWPDDAQIRRMLAEQNQADADKAAQA